MSGKSARKVRKVIAEAYNKQIEDINAKAIFEAYRNKINSYPFKTRLKIAFKIMIRKF